MARIGFHVSHEQLPPSEVLHLVKAAELAGFDCAMSSDHFKPRGRDQSHSGFEASGPASMKALAQGALAGLAATASMTLAMELLWRRLPEDLRYPLPPREIIDQILPEGLQKELGETGTQLLSLAAHFGYGAAVGAIFPLLTSSRRPGAGAAYGVAIWGASYLGWIPAAGILRPASQHPARRNLLMIGAHLIWGAALSIALSEIELRRRSGRRGRPARRRR